MEAEAGFEPAMIAYEAIVLDRARRPRTIERIAPLGDGYPWRSNGNSPHSRISSMFEPRVHGRQKTPIRL